MAVRFTDSRIATQLVFFFLALAVSAVPLYAKEPKVEGQRLDFTLPNLDGSTVSFSDARFAGKVVFVTLWGTWCPPCRSEIPTFVKLQEKYGDDGLVIVGIAFEKDRDVDSRRNRLRKFTEKRGVNYLILDGGHTSEFSDALPMVTDVKGLPIEIIIDRTGRVVKSRNGYGYKKRWARELERELKRLLAMKPSATSP
jgi:thiol-disulfide isomerase/thioredoxin